MVIVLTHFIAKDVDSAKDLEIIFRRLIQETPLEQGFIAYEILTDNKRPNSYYIFEKWNSQEDLDRHAQAVDEKGYVAKAASLLFGKLENIILQTLN